LSPPEADSFKSSQAALVASSTMREPKLIGVVERWMPLRLPSGLGSDVEQLGVTVDLAEELDEVDEEVLRTTSSRLGLHLRKRELDGGGLGSEEVEGHCVWWWWWRVGELVVCALMLVWGGW
jgi:hypothetical protein